MTSATDEFLLSLAAQMKTVSDTTLAVHGIITAVAITLFAALIIAADSSLTE